MKIMFVVNKDIVLYLFRREFVEQLLKLGHKVIIVSPEGEKLNYFRSIGCVVETCLVERRGKNIFKDLNTLSGFKKAIKLYKPEYIFTYTIKPNLYIGFISRFYKIKFIPTITGLGSAINKKGLGCFIYKFFYRFSFKRAYKAFFQNQTNLEWFKNDIKLNIPVELVSGSGVNLDNFKYSEYNNISETNFLFLGRIMKEKGIEEFLDASIRMKEKYKSTVNIYLAGFYEENYESKINDLNNKGIIHYLGFLDDSIDTLRISSALVLPSYHEGLSNVILEAQATGRPVIASNIPGCIEAFDDGISGFSVKAKDSDDLFNKMEKFHLLSLEEKRQMGLNGRNYVSKYFNRKDVIEKYTKAIL